MRKALTSLALVVLVPVAAAAQNAGPPLPISTASPATSGCDPREANLAGIGRAGIVAFTGAVFGERVCATVANVALDAFTAQVIDRSAAPAPGASAPPADTAGPNAPFADVALGEGGSLTLALTGVSVPGVGPYVVQPGGRFPSFGGDTAAAPRVVIAYAGQRLLVIGTTAVTLVDLARVLRDQPDIFGADAVERAMVVASGPSAGLSLRTEDGGTLGTAAVTSRRVLELSKRG